MRLQSSLPATPVLNFRVRDPIPPVNKICIKRLILFSTLCSGQQLIWKLELVVTMKPHCPPCHEAGCKRDVVTHAKLTTILLSRQQVPIHFDLAGSLEPPCTPCGPCPPRAGVTFLLPMYKGMPPKHLMVRFEIDVVLFHSFCALIHWLTAGIPAICHAYELEYI